METPIISLSSPELFEGKINDLCQLYIAAFNEELISNEDSETPGVVTNAPNYEELKQRKPKQKLAKGEKAVKIPKPEKTDGPTKKTAYVTITSDVRQIIASLFKLFLQEVVDISSTDLAEILSQDQHKELNLSVYAVNSACYNAEWCVTKLIYEVINRYYTEHIIGSTLFEIEFDDYIRAKIENEILASIDKKNAAIVSICNDMFCKFIKCISMLIAKFLWKDHTTVNKKFFTALLHMFGMDQNQITTIESYIRPPKKSRTKSGAK